MLLSLLSLLPLLPPTLPWGPRPRTQVASGRGWLPSGPCPWRVAATRASMGVPGRWCRAATCGATPAMTTPAHVRGRRCWGKGAAGGVVQRANGRSMRWERHRTAGEQRGLGGAERWTGEGCGSEEGGSHDLLASVLRTRPRGQRRMQRRQPRLRRPRPHLGRTERACTSPAHLIYALLFIYIYLLVLSVRMAEACVPPWRARPTHAADAVLAGAFNAVSAHGGGRAPRLASVAAMASRKRHGGVASRQGGVQTTPAWAASGRGREGRRCDWHKVSSRVVMPATHRSRPDAGTLSDPHGGRRSTPLVNVRIHGTHEHVVGTGG